VTEENRASETAEAGPEASAKRKSWYRRPTVRGLRKQAETEDRKYRRKWDERDNTETRLPPTEAIHLGGLVLTEAFTPSTVSSLYTALERWPSDRPQRKQEWVDELARSRSGARGGWQNLGLVRPHGAFVMGDGHHDPDLPPAVDAVWLHLSFVTPALAMVVATFTLKEEAGDLSDLLRRDYRSALEDVRVRVYGRLGDLRARNPWSRPAGHGIGYSMIRAEEQKRRACRALIDEHEQACRRWFVAKFPGRFAAAETEARPVIRMLFTKEHVPYGERDPWLRPVGLEFAHPLWRSTDVKGWWLTEERWPYRDGRHVVTLAARRADVAKDAAVGESGESNWYLTQEFGTDGASLAARHAIVALLSLYADRLSDLRDRAGVKRVLRRPVREGRALDDYLIRDGLDAATITSDLEVLTRDVGEFRWGVPEFVEDQTALPEQFRKRPPMEYVAVLCGAIREQGARLAVDTTTTTGNIKASAELRHAIANTTLQRFILALAVAAAVIAVVGLLVAKH
jgi:hypothetical protein